MPPTIPTLRHENVEFKTLDGLKLRGWLYPAASRGPAVIMSPGFNCVKEMLLPEVAEGFQRANISALIYDPRSIGLSDGCPRNEIDPMKQAEDYSDALTWLARQPIVDATKIAFWGMSFSGPVAACAAALDKRARCLIMVCPLFRFYTEEGRRRALSRAMADRVSQAKGNAPFSVVPFSPDGDNPAGMAAGAGHLAHEFMIDVGERRMENFVNRTTIQSYYKIAMWQPWGLFAYIDPTPVMMVIPGRDVLSKTAEQREVFESFEGPKRLSFAPEKHHLDILSGAGAEDLIREQVDFMVDVFGRG